MQRAVKRSQWQEGDRSLIRHMGQASTFLNNNNEQFRSATPLKNGSSAFTCDMHYFLSAFIPAFIAHHARLVPAGVGHLLPPEELSMSSKQYTSLSARRRSGR
jgi:hypothetical protein